MLSTKSAYGASICPQLLQFAISNCGLRWKMGPQQWTSLSFLYVYSEANVTVIKEANDTTKVLASKNTLDNTLFGIPADIIDGMHEGTIELHYNGTCIFKIQNLAVPNGFE